MSENNKKKNRQEWKPHWALKVLYRIWIALFSVFKVAVGAAVTVLLIGIICGFVFVGTLGDYLQDDILPQASFDFEGYDQKENSYIYHVDNQSNIQVYQKVFASTSSEWASYEDIPKAMIDAAIAIEDHRFLEHQGVDWITTLKACARMFFGDDSVGGSSITQQLIKNVLLNQNDASADDVTVQRKMLEIFRAVQVEKRYNKKTIMERYLNVIYLGQGCRGVRSAAATYFGKELEMLTPAECASIISITNNPSLFDPYGSEFKYKLPGETEAKVMTGRERNRSRQMLVLGAMREYGLLTEEEYQEAVSQELVFKNGIDNEDRLAKCPNPDCGNVDIVRNFTKEGDNYYCPVCGTQTMVEKSASQSNYSWFTDTVLRDVAHAMATKDGMEWNDSTKAIYMQQIRTGGYHIYTTLDLDVQNTVDSIYTDLNQIPDTRSGQQLQSAIVVVDNRTGDIVALAGGVGEKTGFDEWNRATRSTLQSGSSIKPLSVYAPAFELEGITPATVIRDLPITYDKGAYPLNDTRTYSYSRTIFDGVEDSVNAVAANTLMKIGAGYSFDFAKEKLGLSTLVESVEDRNGDIYTDIAVGPLALGAQYNGVTVREMTDAFATLANGGVYRKGRTFTKVYDGKGNLVLDNTQESRDVLTKKTVDYMNYCLVNATHNGTGYNADLSSRGSVGITTAGKTGTTGDSKDRWYCGFTGYYTAAVWCGYDRPEVIRGTSGNPAARLWKKVMEPLHRGKSNRALYDSRKLVDVTVCLDSGMLATEACKLDIRTDGKFKRTDTAKVYREDVPTEVCTKHVLVDYCSGGGVATEYCHLFAGVDSSVKIEQKALTKMTREEIAEILEAEDYKLDAHFFLDNYVYFVNEDGSDAVFRGIHGDLEQSVNAPYMVCPVHTKEAWEAYQNAHPTVPSEPEGPSVDPSVPAESTAPAAPSEPNA